MNYLVGYLVDLPRVKATVNQVLLRQVQFCHRGTCFGHASLMEASSSKGSTRATVSLILGNCHQAYQYKVIEIPEALILAHTNTYHH